MRLVYKFLAVTLVALLFGFRVVDNTACAFQYTVAGKLDLSALHLTNVQKEKFQSVQYRNNEKAKMLRKTIKAKKAVFKKSLFDAQSSSDEIKNQYTELTKLKSQMNDLVLSNFLELRNLLTTEQKKLLPNIVLKK